MEKPIRILQVVTYMGRGGLETILMNYYRHIDRTRVQFDFLVHRQFRAEYDDEIEQLGGKIYRLPRLVPWSHSYQKKLSSFFDVHPEYQIVHVHQDCLSSVILKCAQEHGVPVRIAHSHNSNQDKNLKYLIKLHYMKQIPQYATKLFACGKDAGDWMFCGADYSILRNAIDVQAYCPEKQKRAEMRERLGIEPDEFVVGHVGRFSPQKNHEYLIKVFSQLHKMQPHAKLLLVGDGEGRSGIENLVKELQIEENVIFTGIRSDVPDLMQAMDVFVLPSLYEGLPVTMIEAQAAGLPCFISDKVPLECKKTDLVEQIPLEADPERWAEQILKSRNMPREDMYLQIAAVGFDVKENAKWLQEFYLEQWKANT